MPQIRPITDLRKTNEISETCHSKREPIFITKNGYGDLVIMSIETFEHMLNNAAKDETKLEAETEFSKSGQLHDAKQVLDSLRRKHSGYTKNKGGK